MLQLMTRIDFTSLPPTLRTPSLSRNGSNWWILLVLGTLFLAFSVSISFQKFFVWHIFIISVSAFCNMEKSWYDSSDVWALILYYLLYLIIFSSFSLYLIIMTTNFFGFFQPDILCVKKDSIPLFSAILLSLYVFYSRIFISDGFGSFYYPKRFVVPKKWWSFKPLRGRCVLICI